MGRTVRELKRVIRVRSHRTDSEILRELPSVSRTGETIDIYRKSSLSS